MKKPKPRDEVLKGPTYRMVIPEEITNRSGEVDIMVTINESDGVPVEIFIQCDDPSIFQWVALSSVWATRLLRDGHPLDNIADEMLEIHCPHTGHHIPKVGEWVPSLVARIGRTLKKHTELKNDKNDENATESD